MKRGYADKIIVHTTVARHPHNSNDCLKKGENKSRLVNLIQEIIIARIAEILDKMRNDILFFLNENVSHITKEDITISNELSSSQEVANTKLVLHASYGSTCDPNGPVIIRNHSGVVNIIVIIIGLIAEECKHGIIDCNRGNHHYTFCLANVDMSPDEKAALKCFHAFAGGNGYVSGSFFMKCKLTYWNVLQENPRFWRVFKEVGKDWLPSESLVQQLQEFVCLHFGSRWL